MGGGGRGGRVNKLITSSSMMAYNYQWHKDILSLCHSLFQKARRDVLLVFCCKILNEFGKTKSL